jgi:hypothetical protein
VARGERISVRLTAGELALIDEYRDGLSRSGYLRRLLHEPLPNEAPEGPSHAEALRLLRVAALSGSVTATVAYERAARAKGPQVPSDTALEELLRPPT